MKRIVDLRSDTLTKPTKEMREFMIQAKVGDDVFGEDPTINMLQEKVREITGMEAALFVTSGAQGNQVSLNAHTQPGQEVILDINSHIFNYESGAPAMLAGVQLNPLDGHLGCITAEQIKAEFRPTDDHYPQTGLICLENTHNRAGGAIFPLEEIKRISSLANKNNIPLHLDGARLWNASVATGITIKEYCCYFDSVSLCFSKGLGAPVGSVVAGSKAFIKRAHFYRKAYGGGIRQGGILAAACLYALEHHLPLLEIDHQRTYRLAKAISGLGGINVVFNNVETNILIFDVDVQKSTAEQMVDKLEEHGVYVFAFGPQRLRAVIHLEISDEDIEYTIKVFKKLMV